MPLDLPSLKIALENAFGVTQVGDVTVQANIRNMADQVATAIDTYVRSGEVVVTSNGATGTGTPGGPLPIAGLPGTGSVT